MFFLIFPLLAGLLALTGRRGAFAFAAGVSLFFLVLFGLFAAFVLASPAGPFFWVAISGLPAVLLASIFSILAFKHAKAGLEHRKSLASRESAGGLLTFTFIGFVVGALLVGTIGAVEIDRILARAGEAADVRIVSGAATGASEPYAPGTLTVPAGTTVTWFNGDSMPHTVTSDTGEFDSGIVHPGAIWERTFPIPGSYAYHCNPHPWMTGNITVT